MTCVLDTDGDGDCQHCARPEWYCTGNGPAPIEHTPKRTYYVQHIAHAVDTDPIVTLVDVTGRPLGQAEVEALIGKRVWLTVVDS